MSHRDPGLTVILDRLKAGADAAHVVAWRTLPARSAVTAPLPAGLDPRLQAALRRRGLETLYSHQAEAVAAALRGENVVITTPAASGKTLAYNLPVLNHLLQQPAAHALYLFPTKALAQDQASELGDWVTALGPAAGLGPPGVYDGDTRTDRRPVIRQNSRLVISNPDMLHTAILPHHTRWATFFENLRFVILDELHVYRGLFGSHVANVIARLKRIATFYGSQPQFLCASATIANPGELAQAILKEPVTVIENNGAPAGSRHLVLYNPPVVNRELGIRRSAASETSRLGADLLGQQVATIVFARARMTVELLLTYLRSRSTLPATAIQGYRGGYLPTERRAIEQGLRRGTVRGVVATNALELGIDIGQLEAAVLVGYPGSIAATWQQIGRAGRRQGESLALLVATSAPLDQYLMQHPDYFFGQSPEHGRINPDNLSIRYNHLRCAAFELPFSDDEVKNDPDTIALLNLLAEDGLLLHRGNTWYWTGTDYPAAGVSLRSATNDHFVIQLDEGENGNRGAVGLGDAAGNSGKPTIVGVVDYQSAPILIYPGAVYLHAGEAYEVVNLDWDGRLAHVRRATLDYFTEPITAATVSIVQEKMEDGHKTQNQPCLAEPHLGEVSVERQTTGYRKVRLLTHEVLGMAEVELPTITLLTTAFWLTLPESLIAPLREAGLWHSDPIDYGPNWEQQRRAALARDGYRCRHCGATTAGPLHVHHLRPFRHYRYNAYMQTKSVHEAWQEANRLDNLITLCSTCHRRAEAVWMERSALAGLCTVLHQIAPLFLLCDVSDLGVAADARHPDTGQATVFLYDNVPGGVGFSDQLFAQHRDLLVAARDLIAACPCADGCPSCVGPVGETELPAKVATLHLLDAMLDKKSSG